MICYEYRFGTMFACPNHSHIFSSWSLKWHGRESKACRAPRALQLKQDHELLGQPLHIFLPLRLIRTLLSGLCLLQTCSTVRHVCAFHRALENCSGMSSYKLVLLGHFLFTVSSFKLQGIGSNVFLVMVYWTLNSLPCWSHKHKVVHLQVTL